MRHTTNAPGRGSAESLTVGGRRGLIELRRTIPGGVPRFRGISVRRRALGSALQAVGVVLLLLSGATVGYGQWSDWQHALNQPAGPQESLPERLEGYLPEAPSPSGDGGEAARSEEHTSELQSPV